MAPILFGMDGPWGPITMAQVGSHQSLRVVLLHPCPASVDIMRTNFDEFWAEKTWFPP